MSFLGYYEGLTVNTGPSTGGGLSTGGVADLLSTARNITVTGDANWNVMFDGSIDVSSSLSLSTSGVTAGTYGSSSTIPRLTVDSKGRITAITPMSVAATIWSSVTGKPTTIAGFGITDALSPVSPSLVGIPTAPTAVSGTNNTQIATTAYVDSAISTISLNFLDDVTITSPVNGQSLEFDGTQWVNITPISGSTDWLSITGTPTTLSGFGITDAVLSTSLSTTLADYATLISPSLSGTPTAPTAISGTSNTEIATTEFVQLAISENQNDGLKSVLITITSDWTVPVGVSKVKVTVVGGSGGLTGTGIDNTGGTGGTTSFAAYCNATGGSGQDLIASVVNTGVSGTGVSGDINIQPILQSNGLYGYGSSLSTNGAGGFAIKKIIGLVPGNLITCTIGAGGLGGIGTSTGLDGVQGCILIEY